METNRAIYCNCYLLEFDRYKMLGSINSQGELEILRGHKNKTYIEFTQLTIICRECGFAKYINMAVNRPNHESDYIRS